MKNFLHTFFSPNNPYHCVRQTYNTKWQPLENDNPPKKNGEDCNRNLETNAKETEADTKTYYKTIFRKQW